MMKKIVYSLLLFLSVFCSSAATQSAPTPEKKVETALQEKVTQNQSKDFVTFAIHYIEQAKWLFVNVYFVASTIFVGVWVSEKKLSKDIVDNKDVKDCLIVIIFPLIVTCIASVLSTCLHFMNEEKEVKEEGKRLNFAEHFLLKWVPTLLPAVLLMAMLLSDNKVDDFLEREIKNDFPRVVCRMVIIPLCVACLFVAPIATYLIDYMGLTSDEAIKPQKTAQKGDLSFFLPRWASYATLMLVYHMIAGVLIAIFVEKEVVHSLLENILNVHYAYENLELFVSSLLSLVIIALIGSVSAWISYTLEKKKKPYEYNTFRNHLLRNVVSALLSSVCISIMYFLFMHEDLIDAKWEWSKKLVLLSNNHGDYLIFTFVYPPLLYCVIIAPILVVIERYMFDESVQRDSNKRRREEAQTKELNETYNQSKDFVSRVVQWRKDVRWVLIVDYLIFLFMELLPKPEKNFLLRFLGVSLVVTCIAAALNTCLHFMSEEKEVKEEDKRVAFTKHFLAKWIPSLLIIPIGVLFLPLSDWDMNSNDREISKKYIILYFLEKAFICLMAALITPYLKSYLKLSSDDTIKPQKTAQKFSFLERWISYNGSMVTFYTILRIIIQLRLLITGKDSPDLLLFILMATVIGSNAMISYTFEKEKMPSEQKTFGHHFFRNTVPMLLAFLSIYAKVFEVDNGGNDQQGEKDLNVPVIYKLLICGMIIAPIFVAIEKYLFTKESVQRDSSKKSRKKAQTKELEETYNQARSLSTD